LFVLHNSPIPDPNGPGATHRAVAALQAGVRARTEASLACAKALWRLSELGPMAALLTFGCATTGELGERCGLSAAETRELLDLASACEADPAFERLVRDGGIPLAAACIVARVLGNVALLRDGDDWIRWAKTESCARLRSRVRERIEFARANDLPVVRVEVYVPPVVRTAFERARKVASQKARRALSPGETFGVVVEHYLDTFDFQRTGPGKRRVLDTSLVDGRYVPMAVKREIFERQEHRCAIALCDNEIFLEMAHIVAHARGGSREADNLIILCSRHHDMFDAGFLRLERTLDEIGFRDPAGRLLSRRFEASLAPEGTTRREPEEGEGTLADAMQAHELHNARILPSGVMGDEALDRARPESPWRGSPPEGSLPEVARGAEGRETGPPGEAPPGEGPPRAGSP
jgi:hypothetical protein